MKFARRNVQRRKTALKAVAPKVAIKKAINKVKVNNIKKIVKSVLKKKMELKISQQIALADTVPVTGTGLLYNPTSSQYRGWCSSSSIIPLISNGTGEADRIGNQVSPKNLRLKYFLTAVPTTDSTYVTSATPPVSLNTNPFRGVPFRVRVIVFRHKYAIDDNSQLNILQNGNSTASFGSNMDNFFRPYNRDEYTIVHSKTIRMAASKHNSGVAGVNSVPDNVPNGSLSFYAGGASIKLPKKLYYNDGQQAPTNQAFFLAVCLCNEDNQADSAGQYIRLSLTAESQMTFYDA